MSIEAGSVPAGVPPKDEAWLPWDPLAGARAADDPPLDVLLSGPIFFDLIFTGVPAMPQPGEELWSQGMGSCPGGIANLATATARLGLRTGLVAGFGDDAYADWIWTTLAEQEGIDLSASVRCENFHTAITVSIATGGDRAMLTHGHELPEPLTGALGRAPGAKAAVVHLRGDHQAIPQLVHLSQAGTMIFADVGFDETGRWDPADLAPLLHCHAFTPNAMEAMRYTRTDSADRAVRALADLVPLAIVTDGAAGSYAIDSTTGEEAYCPAVPVTATDATGAGDVFTAATVLGVLAEWPLRQRLQFASLCAALAVQQFGGSLAAPGWGDIADWWRLITARSDGGDLRASHIREQYGFLGDVVPNHSVQGVRRAQATFALASDADEHHSSF